jgi:hypothetical protein
MLPMQSHSMHCIGGGADGATDVGMSVVGEIVVGATVVGATEALMG